MFKQSLLPFSALKIQNIRGEIDYDLKIEELTYFNFDFKEEDNFGIILNEERLRLRIEVLANSFEKILLQEAIDYYRYVCKILKSTNENKEELKIFKQKTIQEISIIAANFIKSLVENGSEIPSLNQGTCIVIPLELLNEKILILNENLKNKTMKILDDEYSNLLENCNSMIISKYFLIFFPF